MGNDGDNPYNYLVIDNNRNKSPLSFCLNFEPSSEIHYPLDTSLVTATSSYRNSSLSLKAIITEQLADYINGA